jgi:hypothetical protein
MIVLLIVAPEGISAVIQKYPVAPLDTAWDKLPKVCVPAPSVVVSVERRVAVPKVLLELYHNLKLVISVPLVAVPVVVNATEFKVAVVTVTAV